MTFHLFLVLVLWQLHKHYWNSYLRSFICVDVSEPTRHPCSKTGMMQTTTFCNLEICLRELLCYREEVVSDMRIFSSESVVLYPVCCVVLGCVCVWVCFVSTEEDTWLFAFRLFSNNVRIADQRQCVLMTVRASSVHGMSSKKVLTSSFTSSPG